MDPLFQEFEKSQKRTVPEFRPGDTVRVSVKIIEGDKERTQDYEGVVIGRKGAGLRETFTVRRVSFGVGMERIFPVHSPRLEKIEVLRHGHVRRAKLYYLRDLRGRQARLRERKGLAGLDVAVAAAAEVAPQEVAATQPEAVVAAAEKS